MKRTSMEMNFEKVKDVYSKLPKKVRIWRSSNEAIAKIKEEKSYKQIALFPVLYILLVFFAVKNIFKRLNLLHKYSVETAYMHCPAIAFEYMNKKFNWFEMSIIYILASVYYFYLKFKYEYWHLANSLRNVCSDYSGCREFLNSESIFKRNTILTLIFIQNIPGYILSFLKFLKTEISYYLRKEYAIKGSAVLLAVIISATVIFLVGFKTAETTKKEMSIANQVEYEYYVVKPNDGWDTIANIYKPDYMGIRGNLIDGDKYNYSNYLKEANPDIDILHPGDVIQCPLFADIYE